MKEAKEEYERCINYIIGGGEIPLAVRFFATSFAGQLKQPVDQLLTYFV